MGDGNHPLVLAHPEYLDAARGPAGDANAAHRAANQLSAVGHQYQFVTVGHREGRHHLHLRRLVAARQIDVGEALAAPPRHPVLVSGAAFAKAVVGDRQNELLAQLQFADPRVGKLDAHLRRTARLTALLADLGPAPGARHLQIAVAFLHRDLDVPQDRHGDDVVVLGQPDAADADGVAPGEDAHVGHPETDAFALGGGQQHVVVFGARLHVDQARVLGFQLHGDLAVGHDPREVGQAVAAHGAGRGREHDVRVAPGVLVLRHGHGRRDGLGRLQREQIDQRLAAGLRGALR